MSRKIKIISTIIVLAILCYSSYIFFNLLGSDTINVRETNSYAEKKSNTLIADFTTNEEEANKIYAGKVLEVTGKVKEVSFLNNRNTLILQGEDKDTGIICDMNSDQLKSVLKISKGQRVTIKGVCKGFLKDVVMLNCILIDQKINE